MKDIIIWVIIFFLWISIFQIFQVWEPTIYIDIKHDRTKLLDSIENLKKTSRVERVIVLSDSIIANAIKLILPKTGKIKDDYYYLIDYCIDHYQKEKMLSSMTLDEWYKFKGNKKSWDMLKWGSCRLWKYVSQDYRINELKRVEKTISK